MPLERRVVVRSPRSGLLAVIAVDDPYTPGFTDALEQQMRIVRTWWGPGARTGRGFEEAALNDVRERHDIERFLHAIRVRDTHRDVPLVVYVSSHGVLAPTMRHFLRLPDTDDARLPATGMPTSDVVVAALSSNARHVLVIVNTCHAAAVARELLAWWDDLAPDPERRLHVIATTDTTSQVRAREFATVLDRAHARLRDTAGITRPFLSVGEFLRALQDATGELNAERRLTDPYEQMPGPVQLAPDWHLADDVPTLPNPGYRGGDDLVPRERREVSTGVDELETWLRQACRADPGWYVSGRPRLNRRIADFLYRTSGVLVVTGATATGKSSLLARAVTLSEPVVRNADSVAAVLGRPASSTVPPVGAVHVAVSARNRSSAALLKAIVQRLPDGVALAPPQPGADEVRHWQHQLSLAVHAQPHQQLTVVIDALDEAQDAVACIHDVLLPLADAPRTLLPDQATTQSQIPRQNGDTPRPRRVRLLVAVRTSSPMALRPAGTPPPSDLLGTLQHAFPHADILRTDEPDIRADITDYVHSKLTGRHWDHLPALREEAAATVAAHVGHSFLDARLAAEQLAAAGPVLLNDDAWPRQLQRGTLGLLHQDLTALDGRDLTPAVALTLLRATAFAFGAGLPWADIWPTVSQALSPHPIDNVDLKIQQLLNGGLAGYLTYDTEDDRRVYRPAHDQLSRVLRSWSNEGDTALSHPEDRAPTDRGTRQAHEHITTALAQLAVGDPAGQPHPYLARHLPHHAAAAHLLDDSHLPATLLPWVSGDTIRSVLQDPHDPHDPHAARTWLTAWAAIEPFIRHADLPSRCSSLHLAHTALHYRGLPAHPVPSDAPTLRGSRIRVLWAQWEPPANVLVTMKHPCRALASTTDGARTLIALGSEMGHIDLVDARTGSPLGDPLPAHAGAVRRLFLHTDETGTVLISGSADRHICMWDPVDRRLIGRLAPTGISWPADLTAYRADDGALTVVAVNSDGGVIQWREDEGARSLAPMSAHPLEPLAFALLATVTEDGTHVIVCAGLTLRVRATGSGALLAEHSLDAAIRVLTETSTPGRIAAGHHDGTVTVWDLATGPCHRIDASTTAVTALAALTSGDRHFLAVATSTNIDLWDLADFHRAGRLTGHTDTVTDLRPLAGAQHALLASCARDNTIRTWTGDDVHAAVTSERCAPASLTAAVRHTEEGIDLAVSYATARVQIWNPRTGAEGPALARPAHQPATALAFHPAADAPPRLLCTSDSHAIEIHDLRDPHDSGRTVLQGHILTVRTIAACRTADGSDLALSGSDDHTVRLWDLGTGQLLDTWNHDFAVLATAAASGPHGDLYLASGSADGTARLWRPGTSDAVHTFQSKKGFVSALALDPHAPEGPLVALADEEGLSLWDLHTHQARSNYLYGHTDTIEALAAWTSRAPTPRSYVASASRDGTLRIWDTVTGRCTLQLATATRVRTLHAHAQPARATAILTFAGDAGTAVIEVGLPQ
ncbi:hypothetical protein [Streptomyces sp. bgisy034]|uniref:hypothetical protein n=1 Tax=Streptomyces sp. bgisy034 TaxID=3413774 RepID=UPI003EBED9C0